MEFQIRSLVDGLGGVLVVVGGPTDGDKWLATHPIGSLCVSPITGCVCELIGLPNRMNPVFVPEDAGGIGVISPVQTVTRCLSSDEMLKLKAGDPLLVNIGPKGFGNIGRGDWHLCAEVVVAERLDGTDWCLVTIQRIISKGSNVLHEEGEEVYVPRIGLTRRPRYPRAHQIDFDGRGFVEISPEGVIVQFGDGTRWLIKASAHAIYKLEDGECIETTDGWRITRESLCPTFDVISLALKKGSLCRWVTVTTRGYRWVVTHAGNLNIIK